MINLLIDNKAIVEVKSYNDAYDLTLGKGISGQLTFDSDPEDCELYLKFTTDKGKMKKLFIDDIRIPTTSGYAVVRSYNDAVHYMRQHGCPEVISFDHDLGEADEHSGYDVAKWMVERDMNDKGEFIPKNFTFTVHSMNPVGAENIKGLLNNYLEQRNQNT